jgi:xylitol oxidase
MDKRAFLKSTGAVVAASILQILPLIEEQLAPFGPRPHWGKLFMVPPAHLQAQYARLAEFKASLQHYDPSAKFGNEFLSTNLYSA